MRRCQTLLLLLLLLALTACASRLDPDERRALAARLVGDAGWQAMPLETSGMLLQAFVPKDAKPAAVLTVYIEGDGLAWISRDQPSRDPTPTDPLALRLALRQPSGTAAYLARPCQYLDQAALAGCPSSWWRGERFSEAVVAATMQALDQLKARFAAQRLILVGYSGGGTVATLAAARRRDVDQLITIAGNLDHEAWTTYHRISPLKRSLNPAHQVAALGSVRQWHFVGGKDENITPALIGGFVERFPASKRPVVIIEPRFDHRCCWAEEWPRLAPLFLRPLERQ